MNQKELYARFTVELKNELMEYLKSAPASIRDLHQQVNLLRSKQRQVSTNRICVVLHELEYQGLVYSQRRGNGTKELTWIRFSEEEMERRGRSRGALKVVKWDDAV